MKDCTRGKYRTSRGRDTYLPAYTPARTKHAKQQDERPTNLARRSRGTPFDMIHMGSIVNISAQAAIPFDGIDPL